MSSEVLDVAAFRRALSVERSRADRTGQPLSLIMVCEPGGTEGPSHDGGGATERVAEEVVRRKRCTDIVGWVAPRRLGVLLPHTSAENAWHMLRNVRSRLPLRGPESEALRGLCFCVYAYPLEEEGSRAAPSRRLPDSLEEGAPATCSGAPEALRWRAGRADAPHKGAPPEERPVEWPPASS